MKRKRFSLRSLQSMAHLFCVHHLRRSRSNPHSGTPRPTSLAAVPEPTTMLQPPMNEACDRAARHDFAWYRL